MPASRNVYLSDALDAQLDIEAAHGKLGAGKLLTATMQAVMLGEAPPPTLAAQVYASLAMSPVPLTHEDLAHELHREPSVIASTLANLHRLAPGVVCRETLEDVGIHVWYVSVPAKSAA